ncbi:MAG: polyprenyl synthetase family protein [Elusimicrobiota bacterium]
MEKFKAYWKKSCPKIDGKIHAELRGLKPYTPKRLYSAMEYALFTGGKRLRPVLCLAGAYVLGKEVTPALLRLACSVEFVHTYSLIHDDLPALDNDDYRRGKLTCHKKFDEATAVLTGDALLTHAFELITGTKGVPAERKVWIVNELVRAIGAGGMIGGQVVDLELITKKKVLEKHIHYVYRHKTADLIRASIITGAIAAGAEADDIKRLSIYAENVGLAFQVQDDLLDYNEDVKAKRVTYPVVAGLNKTKDDLGIMVGNAKRVIKKYLPRADVLQGFAEFVINRDR